ncbi:DUF4274 domain-containing protein [Pseudomonas entomophila]|uniref:DUF4274 domain-containing protein n=1 Tax=Pseudomonas entomophila TaxID=312306 RepID=UPI001BCF3A6D|nr:DUF4274 domain-containing protein [Pseudomonas entomophila]QVM93851.1 DUF4274 domain-containing protein [Pseudomonas entomophila]
MPLRLTQEQFLRAFECAELNGIPDRATLLAQLKDPDMRETLSYWSAQLYKAPEDLICVADLQSKEELHYVASHLNWDDGLIAPRAILAHPLCDAGTALLLYWYGQGWWHSGADDAQKDDAIFYAQLVRRFTEGDFSSYSIAFDPFADQFVPDLATLRKRGLQLPGVLFATYRCQVVETCQDAYQAYLDEWQARHAQE